MTNLTTVKNKVIKSEVLNNTISRKQLTLVTLPSIPVKSHEENEITQIQTQMIYAICSL